MKEILNVFKAIEALDKKVGEFEKRQRDPQVKELFWKDYDEMNFKTWEEFEGYVHDQFRMMQMYSTKFKDLIMPTKQEFYDKNPVKHTVELLNKLDNEVKYQTIKEIISFYNVTHKSKLNKGMKLNRSTLDYWLTRKKVEKFDRELTPFRYNVIEVEEILWKKDVLKEKIILKDPGNYMKGMNGIGE